MVHSDPFEIDDDDDDDLISDPDFTSNPDQDVVLRAFNRLTDRQSGRYPSSMRVDIIHGRGTDYGPESEKVREFWDWVDLGKVPTPYQPYMGWTLQGSKADLIGMEYAKENEIVRDRKGVVCGSVLWDPDDYFEMGDLTHSNLVHLARWVVSVSPHRWWVSGTMQGSTVWNLAMAAHRDWGFPSDTRITPEVAERMKRFMAYVRAYLRCEDDFRGLILPDLTSLPPGWWENPTLWLLDNPQEKGSHTYNSIRSHYGNPDPELEYGLIDRILKPRGLEGVSDLWWQFLESLAEW